MKINLYTTICEMSETRPGMISACGARLGGAVPGDGSAAQCAERERGGGAVSRGGARTQHAQQLHLQTPHSMYSTRFSFRLGLISR